MSATLPSCSQWESSWVIRLGRMTALQKPSGGVRGIVVGLVGRTMAQQMSDAVKAATAPFQYALSTRAGTECIAHALQAISELNPETTILSVDGIGAFDLISRKAMLEALLTVDGGSQVLPFVRMFYGTHSQYLWEDEEGTTHVIEQGEGGEQGDPMMPLLFALGQHAALRAVQSRLNATESLFAFHDDVYVATIPDRVGEVYTALATELYTHSRIRLNGGKTQVWNAAGLRPTACDYLERIVQAEDPDARVWRGSDLPTREQGIRVLGTPLGHEDFVIAQLDALLDQHQVLLSRIPLLADVQSAWALLLHCQGGHANYILRVIRPEMVVRFATGHNNGLWQCLCSILPPAVRADLSAQALATLPLSMGGCGLRDALRTSKPAFWASWADCLPMMRERHPAIVHVMIDQLNRGAVSPTLRAAGAAARELAGVEGFEANVGS